MRAPFGKPMIGNEERSAVMRVLDGSILVHGPQATAFEESFAEFCQAPYAISVSSCTAGMHLIYFALGYGSGDEVIVPAQTHVATAHAVELTGAKAVFVDVETETGNIDIDAIESAITPRTRALAIVHYLGVPVNLEKVVAIARKHKLFLLEDCALAPGTRFNGIHSGLHGDAGVFSFYPVKHLTSAEGGMIILRNQDLADKLRYLKAFGVNKTHSERKIPGLYDAIELGFNYRMSEIHAAIGVEQMKKLPKFLAQRQENYLRLAKGLQNLDKVRILPQPEDQEFQSSHYCLGLLLDDKIKAIRAELMQSLTEKGVGTSIYYPHPVPRMGYYQKKYGYDAALYVGASLISDTLIAFPVGPHLDASDIDFILEQTKKTWKQFNV